MTTPILEFVDAVKSFGTGETEVYALRGINLTLTPGELLAVMGPSGCGKSTLLHLAGGLETPSAGPVKVDGNDLGDRSAEELASTDRLPTGEDSCQGLKQIFPSSRHDTDLPQMRGRRQRCSRR